MGTTNVLKWRKTQSKKGFWYFTAWKWTDGIPSIATINDYPGELQILSGSNPTPVTIDRIEAYSALETLGLFTSPSSQNIKQFQETSEKLLSLVSTVRQTPLCTFKADMLLPIYIHPGLRYIFAGTTFDEDTCKVLDRLFLPTLKSKVGYKRTTKLAIMHSSYRYGGAQLPTCWDLQGSTHLSMLIGHLQLKDIAGQYLFHEMDYLYLHIEFQQRVMSYPITDTQSLAPDCWITNTWHYLSSLDGTTISTSIELPLQRSIFPLRHHHLRQQADLH
jgi:hypothetical protein